MIEKQKRGNGAALQIYHNYKSHALRVNRAETELNFTEEAYI